MTFPALPVTWSLDGMTFNTGPDAFGHTAIVDIPEWDSAPGPKPRIDERTEAHGAYQGPNYRAGKVLNIQGTAQAMTPASRETLRDRLAALMLDPDTFYPLTCTNPYRTSGPLSMWVKLNDEPHVVRQRDGVSLTLDIQVFASDPWKYSPDNSVTTINLKSQGSDGILWNGSISASGGIEWNGSPTVSGGWIYESAQGTGGVGRLTNTGNREAPFTAIITAACTNPQLVAIQSQRRVRWVGSIVAPNNLYIDGKTGRVTLGSDPVSAVDVSAALSDSQFFTVPAAGFIDVEFSAIAGAGAQALCTNKNVYV